MREKNWLQKLKTYLPGVKNSTRQEWPDWYAGYAGSFDKKAENVPLNEVEVRVIDAETTGLSPRKDRLLSLGGLRVRGHTVFVRDHFEAYLPTPLQLEGESAVSIHGIVPNSLRYAYDTEEELLKRLLLFLGSDGLIVGHHIGFDLAMINDALARQGAGPLLNQVVDTSKLAERIRPVGYWTPPKEFSLDSLARRYRIPLSDRHTALGDAYITAVLWLKLTSQLKERKERTLTLEDVVG